jgi:hypothetical protein
MPAGHRRTILRERSCARDEERGRAFRSRGPFLQSKEVQLSQAMGRGRDPVGWRVCEPRRALALCRVNACALCNDEARGRMASLVDASGSTSLACGSVARRRPLRPADESRVCGRERCGSELCQGCDFVSAQLGRGKVTFDTGMPAENRGDGGSCACPGLAGRL